MTHVVHIKDGKGDVVDIHYFCSDFCMKSWLVEFGKAVEPVPTSGENGKYSWGAWPGGAETDYDVNCAQCHTHLWDGLETPKD